MDLDDIIQQALISYNDESSIDGKGGYELNSDDMMILRKQILRTQELFDVVYDKISTYLSD